MPNSLISVVIPAYNSERFIAATLDSVFAQTYRPIEVIVVDDGSTDKTAEVVKSFTGFAGSTNKTSKTSPTSKTSETNKTSLTYFYQNNSGPSAARNTGIRAAKGEYIAFLDADDTWVEDKIEKQLGLFERDGSIDVVFCNASVVKLKKGEPDSFAFFKRDGLTKDFFGHEYLVVDQCIKLLKTNFMLTPAVVAKRLCFHDDFFFNEQRRHVEDWELWLKMSLVYKFGYISDVCVHVKDEGDGLCAQSDKMLLAKMEVMENFLTANGSLVVARFGKDQLSAYLKETYKWAGYQFMIKGDGGTARRFLLRSLKEAWDPKTALYYLRTLVPMRTLNGE